MLLREALERYEREILPGKAVSESKWQSGIGSGRFKSGALPGSR